VTSSPSDRSFTVEEIRAHVDGKLEGSGEGVLRGVAGLDEAGEGDLTFLANPKYRSALETTRASAVLVAEGVPCPPHLAVIRTPDPYAALMRVVHLFDPGLPEVAVGAHPTAVVSPEAVIGPEVGIGPHVVVEAGATLGARTRIAAGGYVGTDAVLGEDCYLYPHVYVGRGCRLGRRVHVQAGAVIGSDGFGYAPVDGVFRKIPQIGVVEIADDVEIGANACIDRATLGRTVIGRGTKIDNLVQIAHNVAIAEDGAVAAQSGIAGSTKIGRGVRLGGQAGLVGHLKIGDGASIGAQAGVIGDVAAGETVSGYPARPHRDAMRVEASVRRLPELIRRVRALEARVDERGTDGSRQERGSS
jgi:UDP-3-O-[3-hydroxymyristoyl] glucosamine N-acyltransferase